MSKLHGALNWILLILAVLVVLILSWLIFMPPAAHGAQSQAEAAYCQYPGRWTNPPGGCDNSDPAVPECIKSMYSKSAEKACIDAFVAEKDGSKPITKPKSSPVASQKQIEPKAKTSSCSE